MPLRKYILGTIVCLVTTVAPYAQTPGLPHVAERDVVEGMREKGFVIAPGQVKMLSTIPVRECRSAAGSHEDSRRYRPTLRGF